MEEDKTYTEKYLDIIQNYRELSRQLFDEIEFYVNENSGFSFNAEDLMRDAEKERNGIIQGFSFSYCNDKSLEMKNIIYKIGELKNKVLIDEIVGEIDEAITTDIEYLNLVRGKIIKVYDIIHFYYIYMIYGKAYNILKSSYNLKYTFELNEDDLKIVKVSDNNENQDIENKQNNNLYPSIFENEAYDIFLKWVSYSEEEQYKSISFIFQKLKQENLLRSTNFKTLSKWCYDNKFLDEKNYDKLLIDGCFISPSKILTKARTTSYNIITTK